MGLSSAGDNRRTAAALGDASGVDEVHTELLPEDKVRIIAELRARGAVVYGVLARAAL